MPARTISRAAQALSRGVRKTEPFPLALQEILGSILGAAPAGRCVNPGIIRACGKGK
jgi:hypothetical protein